MKTPIWCLMAAIALPVLASAQQVPVSEIATFGSPTTERFVRISNVHELGNGGIIVNDYGRRALITLDRNFQNYRIVLDSSSVNMGYGKFEGTLFPYVGDSLALMNRYGLSIVSRRTGDVTRWSPARSNPLVTLNNSYTVGVDANGDFVFGANVNQRPPANGDTPAPRTVGIGSDSGAIVRVNFATRAVKPVTKFFRQPTGTFKTEKTDDGRMIARSVWNVLPLNDEFAVLSDGTVAVLRATDHHFDFIDSNGKVESAPRIPFNFTPLTIADRQALIDSARAAQAAADAEGRFTIAREGAGVATGVEVAKATGLNGTKVGEGFSVDVQKTGSMTQGAVTANPGQAVQGTMPFAMRTADIEYVEAAKLPERYPAIAGGRSLVVDRNDNIWIRTTAKDPSLQGAVTFDVVNRDGQLTQRVRVPAGRAIAGFGANGVIYLTFKDDIGYRIERATIRK